MAILLTAAEKRVLELLFQSQTGREIAASLGGGGSPATVKRHLENILRKPAVRNTPRSRPAAMQLRNPGSVGSELSLKVFAICAEFCFRENFQP